MKFGRWLIVIIGATLGSLVAVWWIRNRGLPMLPDASSEGDMTEWIELR
jgi:hypothetical protein